MRIGIIGHFGGNENFTDGQTVKTVTLYRAFVNRNINNGAIHCVDTYYIRKNPIRFIYQMMSMLFFDKKVCYRKMVEEYYFRLCISCANI